MLLPLLYFAAFVSADFCNKNCGDIPRITNGTKVPLSALGVGYLNWFSNRPTINTDKAYNVWNRECVTLIRAFAPNDPENYKTCGGTLINKCVL